MSESSPLSASPCWEFVDRYSVRFGERRGEKDDVVLVPYGKDLADGFERARLLLKRGRSVRLIGLGVTVRAVWPSWVEATADLTLSELWAYRARSTIGSTSELRAAIMRWLDAVFDGAPGAPAPGETLFGSACLRIFEPAIIAQPDVLGIADHHGADDIHVVGGDWIGTFALRQLVARRGGRILHPAEASRSRGLPWAARIYGLGAAALAATAADQIRNFVRANRTRAVLRALRGRPAQPTPETWVVLIADWPRFSRTVIESVAIPELEDSGRVGILLAGSLAPGARDESNMRARVGDELWPGLGRLRQELGRCAVDQVVCAETVPDLARVLASAALASARALARIVNAGCVLKDGSTHVDLLPYARELGILATLDVARVAQASMATRGAIERQGLRGKRIVFASSSPADLATADLLLQRVGASTVELAHGSVGTGEPGARESRAETLCVWSRADARVLEPLSQPCVVAGMPRITAVRREPRSERTHRVLFMSNYLHVGYRTEGRHPLLPFQFAFLHAAVETVNRLGRAAVRWRPHPADDKDAIAKALSTSPGLERSSPNAELAEDLGWADVVVCSPSSSLFQALLVDVPVFLHLTPEYAVTPAADFMHDSRTFFRAEELVPKLAACLQQLEAKAADALAPERAARTALFGPTGTPLSFSEAFAPIPRRVVRGQSLGDD